MNQHGRWVSSTASPGSLRHPHTHRRRNRFSFAAFLQALEPIKGTTETSLGCSLIAKKFVEGLAVRNDVLSYRNFRDRGASQLCHPFQNFDTHSVEWSEQGSINTSDAWAELSFPEYSHLSQREGRFLSSNRRLLY